MVSTNGVPKVIHPDDVGLCNCSICYKDLIGERTAAKLAEGYTTWRLPTRATVFIRVKGRPICEWCWNKVTKQTGPEAPKSPDSHGGYEGTSGPAVGPITGPESLECPPNGDAP